MRCAIHFNFCIIPEKGSVLIETVAYTGTKMYLLRIHITYGEIMNRYIERSD